MKHKHNADDDRQHVQVNALVAEGFTGTSFKDSGAVAGTRVLEEDELAKIDEANALTRQAYALLKQVFSSPMPTGMVQWVPLEKVQANDYNPNSVAMHEMKLLHTSISEDGYTSPVITVFDEEIQKWVIVDGFHRYTTMVRYADISDVTGGHLPISIIDKPPADRIASTVRHNRARGKHSIAGMGKLVFDMLAEGENDETICNKLGLEPEELSRLKHITGFSKLFRNVEYTKSILTKTQLKERADYAKSHPEELPLPEGV